MQRELAKNVHYKRLFILGGVNSTEEEFREQFSEYGEIADVWKIKKDANGRDKGIVYITYEKTSAAALAQEKMNGKSLPGKDRTLKVIIAQDKDAGSNDDPVLNRIFVKVPSDLSENDIKSVFSEYGDVEHVNLLKNKSTGESKGLAFISFDSAYHAALCVENAPEKYKAVFATEQGRSRESRDRDPVGYRHDDRRRTTSDRDRYDRYDRDYGGHRLDRDRRDDYEIPRRGVRDSYERGYQATGSPDSFSLSSYLGRYTSNGPTMLEAIMPPEMTGTMVTAFFGLMPGFEFCNHNAMSGFWNVKYATPQHAAYAKDKLNGFQYFEGQFISVNYENKIDNKGLQAMNSNLHNATVRASSSRGSSSGREREKLQLQQFIQRATQMLARDFDQGDDTTDMQYAGSSNSYNSGDAGSTYVSYTEVPLPAKQPTKHLDTPTEERLFVITQPDAVSIDILTDLFCRFGNLIRVHHVHGRNYGYALFASKESAQAAIDLMHGQTVCGMFMKVIKADPPRNADQDSSSSDEARSHKRPRY